MNARVAVSLAVSVLCILALLQIVRHVVWNGSLTTARVTVFVNEVDSVGDAKCDLATGSYFDVTLPDGPTARFSVKAFDESEQVLSAVVRAREAKELEVASIKVQLMLKDDSGNDHDVHLVPQFPSPAIAMSEDDRVISWFQKFRITEDVTKARDGSVRLQWSIEYRDANGGLKQLSITVPLRKTVITIPSSIVASDPDATRAWAVAAASRRDSHA